MTSAPTGGMRPRPVVLCVLDGWGHRENPDNNAIRQAHTPVWDRLMRECPNALLGASAQDVGLPEGQMGNSEVGHMNLGAGRVVLQDLPRIDDAIAAGTFAANPELGKFVDRLSATGGTAHVMGLMSPGGVHAHQRHIAALAQAIAVRGIPVAVHAFLDGRDTPPKSAPAYLRDFLGDVAGLDGVRIATVSGRYYAMDRDRRWPRTALAYRALVDAQGVPAENAGAAVEAAYGSGDSDEFVKPAVIADYAGMADGDGLVMANFRADRARQILTALLDPDFGGFARGRRVEFASRLGMTEYSYALNGAMAALFPAQPIANGLGEVVAAAGLRQLRIAETEKYAHVTFFLNGGEERQFPGEERILVPSPKVATYDLQPEMAAPEVADRLVEAIGSGRFDFIVVNFANTDMVGHTGDLEAAVKAVEAVDTCLGRLRDAVTAAGGTLLITADHGNAEMMVDNDTGQPHTAHTSNLVPVILAGEAAASAALRNGRLADVAPTVLALLGLPQPAEMTGRSLVSPVSADHERTGFSATA